MAPGFWTLGCGPGFYATRIAQLFRLFSGASAFLARRARSSAVPLGGESPPFQTGATLQHFPFLHHHLLTRQRIENPVTVRQLSVLFPCYNPNIH